MDKLALLKANLGITTDARDQYLNAILKSTQDELSNQKGIDFDESDQTHLMFLVDYSAWRYRNRGEGIPPRNLKYRLHNLLVHDQRGDKDG
ncbi:MAG: phage head-tail connector protein [Lactobacillus sp.]|jgi:hypothetical protein|nr:phage head-tail connector protein [Lactobacillus sp.]